MHCSREYTNTRSFVPRKGFKKLCHLRMLWFTGTYFLVLQEGLGSPVPRTGRVSGMSSWALNGLSPSTRTCGTKLLSFTKRPWRTRRWVSGAKMVHGLGLSMNLLYMQRRRGAIRSPWRLIRSKEHLASNIPRMSFSLFPSGLHNGRSLGNTMGFRFALGMTRISWLYGHKLCIDLCRVQVMLDTGSLALLDHTTKRPIHLRHAMSIIIHLVQHVFFKALDRRSKKYLRIYWCSPTSHPQA